MVTYEDRYYGDEVADFFAERRRGFEAHDAVQPKENG